MVYTNLEFQQNQMGLAISRRENKRIACLINGITTRHIACSVENVGCLQGSMFQKMATIDSKRLKELGFTDFQIYVLKKRYIFVLSSQNPQPIPQCRCVIYRRLLELNGMK